MLHENLERVFKGGAIGFVVGEGLADREDRSLSLKLNFTSGRGRVKTVVGGCNDEDDVEVDKHVSDKCSSPEGGTLSSVDLFSTMSDKELNSVVSTPLQD